jgi:hypothetical protein
MADQRKRALRGNPNVRRLLQCYGKQRFETFTEAAVISSKTSGRTQPYRCKFCRGFHVGSHAR